MQKKNVLPSFFVLSILATSLSIFPVKAALFGDDEARQAIQRTDQKVRAVDSRLIQLEETQRNQGDALGQLEQTRQDIANLRGQIEVIQNDLEHVKRGQRDFYSDLDHRVKTLETSAASQANASNQNGNSAQNNTDALPSGARTSRETPGGSAAEILSGEETASKSVTPSPETLALLKSWRPSAANEKKQYDQAFNYWKQNKYSDAAPLFFHFSKLYPKSTLAGGSLYYAGLSWRIIKNNASAQEAFQMIVQYYPDHPRTPNALFVLGQIAYEQGDVQSARRLWKEVVDHYPLSDVAKKARTNLDTYKGSTAGARQ
ncbi:MAG: tol-pal system protein YbgF [Pseudomonadota bacterium]